MVSLEKIAHLSIASGFDSLGPESISTDPGKLNILGAGTKYDICTTSCAFGNSHGICHSFTHDGRCISLFKTLYTNHCSHQCNYCTNASSCSERPGIFSYTPEELAGLTISLYRSNYIEGLFLSSGAGRDEDLIMERLIETARLLRFKHGFKGYIHLKILPGASHSHIREAMELSDRLSVNIEAPSASHMREMSPTKDYENDIISRQRYIRDLSVRVGLRAGQTTQLVIGSTGENDEEIFRRVLYEYEELKVGRAYFSAFSPQKGTGFEMVEPQSKWREHRLYQVDWLYRIYRFDPGEIKHAFDENGFLSDSDPKVAIAKACMDSPVDPNTAPYGDLLRVPGIGQGSARRIMALRRQKRISRRQGLSSLGVMIKRASPFLKINGWRDTTLEMWS
jgi:predicted DNA-binding helix-hairpin-helix protein